VSKASRRQQRQAKLSGTSASSGATGSAGGTTPATGAARPATEAPRPSSSPSGTARAGRRERQRVTYQQNRSFMERYRGVIIGVAAVVGIALIGGVVFIQASQPAYLCTTLFDPAPTPTPPDGSSPQPGYQQDDMGAGHVAVGTQVKYTYCAPASGKHYASPGGPISPRVYGPDDTTVPQGWVHNLEHGALVVLYRSDSPGATPEGQAALRAFFDDFPDSPICGIPAGTSQGPVITMFNDMATPYAALVWGRYLPLDRFDPATILDFYSVWGERTNPEPQCPAPTPVPSEAPSASPVTSPSAAPSASPSAAPSASPSPS
jgi:Protein of unknown function (DUF3105)